MSDNLTPQRYTGILESDGHHGASLREISLELDRRSDDPRVNPRDLHHLKLRPGSLVEYECMNGGRGRRNIGKIVSINGLEPDAWCKIEDFNRRTAIDPFERLRLTTGTNDLSMRVVDLLSPVGKGQRALIVAPPRSGKTMLMQAFARAITANHPEIELIVLLIDERPEEVTDMRRTIHGKVFASSSDSDRESHVRIGIITLEYAKRQAEAGKDVVILLDSLTKMGRAFNAVQKGSGRTLSGGVDSRALEIPKKIFGSARTLEGGGSLTIIATALIDTNSRMDELIFQEFKGTGNMELVLNRDLANERIYPAINIPESGTRHEEILFGRETARYQALRRALHKLKPREAMKAMLKLMEQYDTNRKLLARVGDAAKLELDD